MSTGWKTRRARHVGCCISGFALDPRPSPRATQLEQEQEWLSRALNRRT
jgi:hypothetical protein